MFKELKEIIFKESKENMILIKEYLQGNENYKNLPYGNSLTEEFNNWIEILYFKIKILSIKMDLGSIWKANEVGRILFSHLP